MTLRQRYERLYAGLVYDAMTFDVQYREPFVVHHAVRSIWPLPDQVVCGPAFTCRGGLVRAPEHIDETRAAVLAALAALPNDPNPSVASSDC